jgi:hypothetical protein
LKIIADSQITQTRGRPPAVPDPMPIRIKARKVHTFSRRIDRGSVTPSTTVDTLLAYSFSLSDLPDYAEFTNLFDQYRIVQIALDFEWVLGPSSGVQPLYVCFDQDDAVTPTALTNLLEYDTVSTTVAGANCSRVLTPRVATALYGGAFTQFGNNPATQWVDAAYPSVQYYGVKVGILAASGNPTGAAWRLLCRYVVQCRSQH